MPTAVIRMTFYSIVKRVVSTFNIPSFWYLRLLDGEQSLFCSKIRVEQRKKLNEHDIGARSRSRPSNIVLAVHVYYHRPGSLNDW